MRCGLTVLTFVGLGPDHFRSQGRLSFEIRTSRGPE
jgi:hypothetical protein